MTNDVTVTSNDAPVSKVNAPLPKEIVKVIEYFLIKSYPKKFCDQSVLLLYRKNLEHIIS